MATTGGLKLAWDKPIKLTSKPVQTYGQGERKKRVYLLHYAELFERKVMLM